MALFTAHIAIDLGTVNVLVHDQNRGVVLQEPSVVAVREDGNKTIIVEVGRAAKDMYGRTPEEIEVMRPLRDGVIASDGESHDLDVLLPEGFDLGVRGPFLVEFCCILLHVGIGDGAICRVQVHQQLEDGDACKTESDVVEAFDVNLVDGRKELLLEGQANLDVAIKFFYCFLMMVCFAFILACGSESGRMG